MSKYRAGKIKTLSATVVNLIQVTIDILEMHNSDPQLLPRFISYFDGEKDPRNLMIIFGVLNVIMTEWDASSCVQVG
jgi:Dos2-interacting transcription regulator of RNA-Pol-II